MKTVVFIALLATFTCRISLAQTAAEKEVLQFEHDACKAFLDADPAALEHVLTDDFTLAVPIFRAKVL
jgi:hypothetical protein